MQLPDFVMGAFEAVGGLLIWNNVRRLLKDKQVRGTDWRVTAFFWMWGVWNLYYYPHLHQWAAFVGGLPIVCANCAWVALAMKYRHA